MASLSSPSEQEPPSKRLKQNENDEDIPVDEESLLKLLKGNADDEEEAARKRRLQRRQRWKSADNNNDDNTAVAAVNETLKEASPPSHHQEQQEVAVMKSHMEDAVEEQKQEQDDFDMFSSSVSPVVTKTTTTTTTNTKKDDFDDDEGYYKPVIGETIDCISAQYKVLGIVGKGVFSTVVKGKQLDSETQVALKLIRNNDTMAKAALTEIRILRKLSPHPHVVQLLHPTSIIPHHYNHVVMCFDYQQYNLRDVLQKFGRGVGISLQSVQLYFPQLLSALRHLKQHEILHSDLKPDNILVSGDFSTLQVCDFGSATMLDEGGMIPTPYLVSRYYRAPEIILGAIPSYPIDLWSAAVTVVELFLGKVLFHGNTNNDMILNMMQILGPFSPKQMKQHELQCNTHPGLPRQFEGNYFLQQDVDKATGVLVKKKIATRDFPIKPLQSLLLKAKSASDSRVLVMKFVNLLKSCLALDPTRRMDLRHAMHHEFFQPPKKEGKGH